MLLRSTIPTFPARRAIFNRASIRFSSTNANPMRYGFVGLGQMGHPMALNLLRKTTPGSTFTIYDVNPLSLSRFVNEASTLGNVPKVHVAHNPRDVASRSVSPPPLCFVAFRFWCRGPSFQVQNTD